MSGDRCFICGEDNPNVLEEHHIVPCEYGGSERDENKEYLCACCHRAVHRLYDRRFYSRLGIVKKSEVGAIETDLDRYSAGERPEIVVENTRAWQNNDERPDTEVVNQKLFHQYDTRQRFKNGESVREIRENIPNNPETGRSYSTSTIHTWIDEFKEERREQENVTVEPIPSPPEPIPSDD